MRTRGQDFRRMAVGYLLATTASATSLCLMVAAGVMVASNPAGLVHFRMPDLGLLFTAAVRLSPLLGLFFTLAVTGAGLFGLPPFLLTVLAARRWRLNGYGYFVLSGAASGMLGAVGGMVLLGRLFHGDGPTSMAVSLTPLGISLLMGSLAGMAGALAYCRYVNGRWPERVRREVLLLA